MRVTILTLAVLAVATCCGCPLVQRDDKPPPIRSANSPAANPPAGGEKARAEMTRDAMVPASPAAAEELKEFVGTWQCVSVIEDGTAWPGENTDPQKWLQDAQGNWQVVVAGQVVSEGTLNVEDPSASPKTYRAVDSRATYIGIYRFVGDTVEMCSVIDGQPRPTEFASTLGSGRILDVWRRVSDEAQLVPANQPPTAQRVAKRAMVLSLVMYRASLEQFAGDPQYEALHARLPDWIERLDLDAELEPEERDLLVAPLGRAEEQAVINAEWRSEGLIVLAWALRRIDLPPYDQPAKPREVAAAVGFSEESLAAMDAAAAQELLRTAELRPSDEIDRYAAHATIVNWRLRTQRLAEWGSMDFVAYLREHPSFHESWLTGLQLVDNDLTIKGTAIGDADAATLATCESTAVERQIAAYWLQGDHAVYSQVDPSTILTGLGEADPGVKAQNQPHDSER